MNDKLKARMTIEIIGSPVEILPKFLQKVMIKFKERGGVSVFKEVYLDPTKVSDKMFSSFVEVECGVNAIETLLGLVIDFGPSSVEILEPDEINLKTGEFQAILNDLVIELRKMDAKVREVGMQNFALNKRIEALTGKIEQNK